ncbi:MAG: phage holin family protein [Chloroflexota bacterium]|nr:phage holin family protein [Chloroflexota bacterium]
MRRLIDFYRLQIHVMRTWRPSSGSRVRRIVATLVVSVVSFGGAVFLTPGYDLAPGAGPLSTALLAAILLGVLNVLVRPVFIGAFAGISVIAVALATIMFQVVSFAVLPNFVEGLVVSGLIASLVASFMYAIVNTFLTAIFSISSDDSYFAVLVQQLSARQADVVRSDKPGLVVVQIDGLAQPILARQVRAGRVPHLSDWVRSGRYHLNGWEALLPPTTPASQAGLLHGNNDGIPAFRWYEKETGRTMVTNHPEDAVEVAARISNGEGLLSNDGASVGNLFSGDAARSYITMATIKDKAQGLGQSTTFFSFFASPYNYLSTIVRSGGEIIKEYIQARRQERAGIVPRMHRGMPYPVARAATNVALRDLSTSLVIEEMYRGTPVIYVDYTDYDEIAHHSGPERGETFDALDGVDRAIATLEKAAGSAPRPYRFVILSDHGQTLGATFLQRYGKTLGDVVRELMGGQQSVEEEAGRVEEWGQTNAFLSELTQVKGVSGSLARTALRSQTSDGVVELGPAGEEEAQAARVQQEASEERPDLIAIASGNLGLVYFPQMPGRVTLEQLATTYPGLVDALAAHPGVGALLLRSEQHGGLVIGHAGINYLDEGRVQGVDPVAQYGGRSREAFIRLDGIEHCPDISVISLYDPEFEEVAAFEELIGSHGGLGGAQTQALLLHPTEWELDEELVGAPAVYRQIRRWAERHLDMRFGKDGTAAPLPLPGSDATRGEPAA